MLSLFLYLSLITKTCVLFHKQNCSKTNVLNQSHILSVRDDAVLFLAVEVMKGEFWTVLANCKLAVVIFT